jgi:ribose 5-phosphate isomerase A
LNPKNQTENAKKNAALEAVKHVKDGFIMGLGSGSTAAYAIQEIGNRIRLEGLRLMAVPTSYQAFALAVENGIQITTLEEHPLLDLTIDGADQVDERLNLIKGMGGALVREKIVAAASRRLIIIADESKKVKFLGANNHPIPLEIIPFAVKPITLKLKEMGGNPVLREGKGKVGPVITDNGNVIMDAAFGLVHEPSKLEPELKSLPGLVETGLFINMTNIVYFGKTFGIEKMERK